MGKEKNKEAKKNLFRDKLSKMEQVRRELEKEQKKLVVECSHQNEKGKLKIYQINEQGEYQCKYCKQTFNMDPLSQADIKAATKIMHDAIQQVRCYSDPTEDEKLIRLLGELDFNLSETAELYERVASTYGKGNGKKNKKNKNKGDGNDFGAYGAGQLSFIGGGKRR
jgi:coenzyme F420-reducing hydrogenase beta subunit